MEILIYLLVFLFGCVSAFAELLSRYTDSPLGILKVGPSYIYLAINGISSIIAYCFISAYQVNFGPIGDSEIGKIILAGTASMVLLRSSFASIKYGKRNIEAGISSITQIFLNTADRAFDRKRSEINLNTISEIMKNVDFKKAEKDLPTICLTIMQNVSNEEQQRMGEEVQKLSKEELDYKTKSIGLGVIIARVTGPDLLNEAVTSLDKTIELGHEPEEITVEKRILISRKEKIEKLKKKFK